MGTIATAVSKDDFLSEIRSISTTLTEEAVAAARKKSKEAGFDLDRGLVPLQESFINLLSARAVLEDAIEKQKLVQLPITVQKEILSNLQTISKSLQGLTDGTDEIVNLTGAIETLNTSIWKYGLHNLSEQVLGYQKKLNQIKNQEVQLSRAIAELETAQKAAERATAAATEVEAKRTDAVAALEQVKQTSAASAQFLEQIKEAGTKISALHSTVQQQEKQSGELTSNIKTANNELTALDGSIRRFYGEVEEYRKKINQTNEDAASLIRTSEAAIKKMLDGATDSIDTAVKSLHETERSVTERLTNEVSSKALETKDALSNLTTETKTTISNFQQGIQIKLDASVEQTRMEAAKLQTDTQAKIAELETKLDQRSDETIEANQRKTDLLIEELATLKEQIREQIQQATGFQLFGAFQSRQNEIAKSKKRWVWAIAALVVISAGVTIWIAHEAQFYNANSFAFWVKLSLTVPLGFALTFCTVQYNRERRLEEEYAFKSSISVSLNPYRDLIQTIVEKAGGDLNKYADFIVDTVRSVFTAPTDKVFEKEKKVGLSEKTLKTTAEIIGAGVRAAK